MLKKEIEDDTCCKFCKIKLEAGTKQILSCKSSGIICSVSFWYCPKCGLVYHFKDLEHILTKKAKQNVVDIHLGLVGDIECSNCYRPITSGTMCEDCKAIFKKSEKMFKKVT